MAGVSQNVERRLLSPRAARDAFAEDDRARLQVIDAAEFGSRFAKEFTTYFRDLGIWYERAGNILSQLPTPPTVPEGAASVLSRTGSSWAKVFALGEELSRAREGLLQAAHLAPKAIELFAGPAGGGRREEDIRWRAGGTFAMLVASQYDLKLGPSEMAMVGVASGIDEPLDPSDFGGEEALRRAYKNAGDKWRKRMDEITPLITILRDALPPLAR